MIFTRFFLVFALAFLVLAQPLAAKQSAKTPQPETTLEVKAKLDAFALKHVQSCNRTLVPSRTAMQVTKEKGKFVARFLEADPDTLVTEIYPGKHGKSQYVGHLIYLEKQYENSGKSRAEAEKGPFKPVKARRIREITRYYQGIWHY